MAKILTKAFIFTISASWFNLLAACSCVGDISMKQAVQETDFIFRGKAVEENVLKIAHYRNDYPRPFYANFTQYTFEIQHVYKGRIREKSVTITTSRGCCACGYTFDLQRDYIVYADWSKRYHSSPWEVPKYLSTSICKRTTSEVAEEVKAIKKVKWWRKAVPLFNVDVVL
jgi:hypothetical protein